MLPSMGPIMSSMPILEPAEAMETDVPLEEVFMMFFVYRLLCCVIVVCVISVSFMFIVVFRVRCVQIMMCFKMW